MKKFLALLVSALMLLSVGCASAASVEEIAATEAELRMIWWGSQTRHDYTMAANEVFMAKYPNIKIVSEYASWDQYWTKLSTMAAAGNLPDIIQQDYKYITAYEADEKIIDLFPYVENGVLDLSDVPDANWKSGIVDEKLVAINLGVNSMCSMIDAEIFEKAGIAIPEDTWTLDEYVAILEQLYAKKDELGIQFPDQTGKNNAYEYLAYRFREAGLEFYNQDGSNAFGWEKEQGKEIIVDFLKFEKDLSDRGLVAPLAVRQECDVNGPESGLIVTGKAAINTANWSNQVKAIGNAAGKAFVLVAAPNFTAEKQQYMKPSQFLSVTSDSKNPDQAAFYINAFTNDIDMNMELKGERGVPIANTVRDALAATFEEGSADAIVFDYIGRVGAIAKPIWAPEPTAHSEIQNTYLWNMLNQVLEQDVDPEAAFEEFYSNCEMAFFMAE